MSQNQEGLTPRQVQMLNTIAGFQTSRGYLPTIGELAERLSISRTTAFEHIEQLRRKGLVSGLAGTSSPRRARSLKPTSKARKLLRQLASSCVVREVSCEQPTQYAGRNTHDELAGGIPFVGMVAAGLPVEAVENREHISIESCFGNRDDIFALEVRGDSMVGDYIHSGDYVICRRTSTATDGQLVVAIVDNGNATLKRFYKEPGQVRLQPANNDYEPIYSDNCLIQGIVIGLVRKL